MTDFERHVLGMEEGVVLLVAVLSMLWRLLFVVSFGNPIIMSYGLLRFLWIDIYTQLTYPHFCQWFSFFVSQTSSRCDSGGVGVRGDLFMQKYDQVCLGFSRCGVLSERFSDYPTFRYHYSFYMLYICIKLVISVLTIIYICDILYISKQT